MEASKDRARRDLLNAAQERGWITLDELLRLSEGSPVDLEEATALTREAGIDLIEDGGDAWEDVATLAEEGPEAFRVERERPARAEELLPGEPAALYLREISQTPLLTSEEEVQLAKQMEAGKEAQKSLARGGQDAAERARFEEAVRQGDAARKRLIEANLRLVVSVAKKYLGRGLSFLDLVQEGNIGLQKGAEKYDWRKGYRFSTYAYWWIRQAIGRAVAEHGRTIRLPVHVIEQLTKLYNVARDLQAQLGRPPTPGEIGEKLGVEPEKVREAFRAARMPISLERPIGEEAEATLGDFIADAAAPAPAQEAEEEVLAESLDKALGEHLSPREAQIVRLRFGLDRGGLERTLGEVGKELGISRERARQLEGEAITKLRTATSFRRQFGDYAG
jgi:RNA polymerase primary sigma factor